MFEAVTPRKNRARKNDISTELSTQSPEPPRRRVDTAIALMIYFKLAK